MKKIFAVLSVLSLAACGGLIENIYVKLSPEELTLFKNIEIEEKKDDEYEKICFLCHRPESVAGKMIDLPSNICVCADCMQKSFDAMNNMQLDLNQLSNTPGIHFMNLSDLENIVPKKQKI